MLMLLLISILVVTVLPPVILAQSSIGCFVSGECRESLVVDSMVNSASPEDCLEFCDQTVDCNHFSHYDDANVCFAFANCVSFSNTSCSDCISGDAGCSSLQCFITGHCDGVLIGFASNVQSAVECLNLCKMTDNCAWWTYDSSDQRCLMTQNCIHIDPCQSCFTGQKDCRKCLVSIPNH